MDVVHTPDLNPRVVALVPAHNEAAHIRKTIRSLRAQSYPIQKILVIADNCTDETVHLAQLEGVRVIRTINNSGRKAGALNQGFREVERLGIDPDYIIQMDADTQLGTDFVETAVAFLEAHASTGAVCVEFKGRPDVGITRPEQTLSWLQRAEFTRYHETRLSWGVPVLSGTGVAFRMQALRDLHERRLYVWRESSLVEDYEITIALRNAGWQCHSGPQFVAQTDCMRSVRDLWRQRLRWQQGTLEELRRHGWQRGARLDVARLGLGYLLMFWSPVWIVLTVVGLARGWFDVATIRAIDPWIFAIPVMIALRNAWSLRSMGVRSMLAAASLVPEAAYNALRYAWMTSALWSHFRRKKRAWA